MSLPIATAVSLIRFEKPHSLSYQVRMRTIRPSMTRIARLPLALAASLLAALAPALAAAELGLPVLDGDLMGRALPRIDQTTLALDGHLDAAGRLWVEGRLAHVVVTADGALSVNNQPHDLVVVPAVG